MPNASDFFSQLFTGGAGNFAGLANTIVPGGGFVTNVLGQFFGNRPDPNEFNKQLPLTDPQNKAFFAWCAKYDQPKVLGAASVWDEPNSIYTFRAAWERADGVLKGLGYSQDDRLKYLYGGEKGETPFDAQMNFKAPTLQETNDYVPEGKPSNVTGGFNFGGFMPVILIGAALTFGPKIIAAIGGKGK